MEYKESFSHLQNNITLKPQTSNAKILSKIRGELLFCNQVISITLYTILSIYASISHKSSSTITQNSLSILYLCLDSIRSSPTSLYRQ